RISFDLTAVPDEITRIVGAASRYDGAHFGNLDDLLLTLADGSGEELLRFAIGHTGSVSAFIFGELYRRGGDWKFRAVGQGYDTGLAGLATDFGVDVDDAAAAQQAALVGAAGVAPEEPTAHPSAPTPAAAPAVDPPAPPVLE